MRDELGIALLQIVKRKGNEMLDEAIDLLAGGDAGIGMSERVDSAGSDPAPATPAGGWTAAVNDARVLDAPPPSGGWQEVGRDAGETYRWPDGNIDEYEDYVRYRGTGGFAGRNCALGYLSNGDVVGFVLGAGGGSKRGITYFFPTDDFDQTREKVSMIRGGGDFGRSGFGPADPTPRAYADFNVQLLRDRKGGKWNVQAVVVDAGDTDAMLLHTALQAMLRGLT